MSQEEKININRALWIFLVFSIVAIIPPTVLGIMYGGFNNSQEVAQIINVSSAIDEDIDLPVVEAEQIMPNIMLSPIVIMSSPQVKTQKRTVKKLWACKSPRKLEQGSGMVKECEWK